MTQERLPRTLRLSADEPSPYSRFVAFVGVRIER
jgi:hypothetical protein